MYDQITNMHLIIICTSCYNTYYLTVIAFCCKTEFIVIQINLVLLGIGQEFLIEKIAYPAVFLFYTFYILFLSPLILLCSNILSPAVNYALNKAVFCSFYNRIISQPKVNVNQKLLFVICCGHSYAVSLREDELYEEAKKLQVPYELVKQVHDSGRLARDSGVSIVTAEHAYQLLAEWPDCGEFERNIRRNRNKKKT